MQSDSSQTQSWVPRQYQEHAIRLGITQACAGFLLRPGMGKTTIFYAIKSILLGKRLCKKTLVICPIKPMYNVWPHQKNMWEQFKHLRVAVAHGRKRVETLKSLDYDILVINPEGLEWLEEELDFVKKNFDILCVDESTRFKSVGTQRFKRLKKFIPFFKRRYILTGSFTPKGLLDLFGQIYILDEGGALGRFITHYKKKWFHPVDYMEYDWRPNEGAAEEIAEKISPLCLVLEREGNIEMPTLLPPNDIYVDLPAEVRVKYDEMEDKFITRLKEEGDAIIAANAGVASSKCRQIANGALYDESHSWTSIHNLKCDAVADLVDQLSGEPLLVLYEFEFDRIKLKEAFPEAALLTTGNATKDNEQVSLFSRGDYSLALAQVKSISLGIDGLQRACANVCMYALTWDLEAYSQSIDRVWRPGQKSQYVTIHRIIARDTVDERVIKVLGSKEDRQTAFLGMLRDIRSKS